MPLNRRRALCAGFAISVFLRVLENFTTNFDLQLNSFRVEVSSSRKTIYATT